MSSAYSMSRLPGPAGGRSLVNNVYSVGDSTLPWGTPLNNIISLLNSVPIFILADLLSRKLHNVFWSIVGRPRFKILYFKPLVQTLSNAFATSLRITYTWCLFAKAFAIVSCITVNAVVVPFCGRTHAAYHL